MIILDYKNTVLKSIYKKNIQKIPGPIFGHTIIHVISSLFHIVFIS